MSADSFDVAIVGGGIVGLGAALAAVDQGLRVVVIERSGHAIGASVRNFGHVCLTAQTGLARDYAIATREIWLRLGTDAQMWVRESGTLVAARRADEMAVLEDFARHRQVTLLGDRREVELLSGAEAQQRVPLAPGAAAGGAYFPYDLQVDPRRAVAAITRHLTSRGVEFRTRTNAGAVARGLVHTSRGAVTAGLVVVAIGHDLDQLLPELAESHEVRRCGLDMMRVRAKLRAPLEAPLLTGWSLLRYSGLAQTPAAVALRERLHGEHPHLAALDLNQMYTQLPDGSLIVGDTHYRGATIEPFQYETAALALIDEAASLFGIPAPRVIERWQGVYASAPKEFLVDTTIDDVVVLAVTTGIGMTTGLGFAALELSTRFDAVRSPKKGST